MLRSTGTHTGVGGGIEGAYLDGPDGVFAREAHADQGHHGQTVKDGRREAEKVDQRPDVARNDHDQTQQTLTTGPERKSTIDRNESNQQGAEH